MYTFERPPEGVDYVTKSGRHGLACMGGAEIDRMHSQRLEWIVDGGLAVEVYGPLDADPAALLEVARWLRAWVLAGAPGGVWTQGAWGPRVS